MTYEYLLTEVRDGADLIGGTAIVREVVTSRRAAIRELPDGWRVYRVPRGFLRRLGGRVGDRVKTGPLYPA